MADMVRTLSHSSSSVIPPSPSESVFSNVDLTESPSVRSTDILFSSSSKTPLDEEASLGMHLPHTASSLGRPAGHALPFKPTMTAVNAEGLLSQARGIDADVEELQGLLMRVSSSVEEARGIADRAELEELASGVKKELDAALTLVRKSVKGQVSAMQQEATASLRVPGCGVGTPTFHMRQTVANSVKNKLRRRRDNALDIESRLNMGIRDTAKRRYMAVVGSAPTEDLVDRLCSPAPPECKLGTLTRREPQVDEKMSDLLKEMEIRNNMAIDTGKKLNMLERELTFVVDILEHDETAFQYELSVEKKNRRTMFMCICLGFFVFVFVVFIIPALAIYLP